MPIGLDLCVGRFRAATRHLRSSQRAHGCHTGWPRIFCPGCGMLSYAEDGGFKNPPYFRLTAEAG